MTKAEYIAWKASRGDVGQWAAADCRAADELIREHAMQALYTIVKADKGNKLLAAFAIGMVRFHWGSAEVDALMSNLKCYPDWI